MLTSEIERLQAAKVELVSAIKETSAYRLFERFIEAIISKMQFYIDETKL